MINVEKSWMKVVELVPTANQQGMDGYACLQKMKMGIKLEQEDATKHENDTIELKVTRIVI